MVTSIKKFSDFIWKNRNKITFTIMIVMIILFWRQCGQIKYERKKSAQNQMALTDSLTKVKQANGDLIVQKSTFIANAEELKSLNKGLSEEVELLKKQKSKPKVVIKTVFVYVDSGKVKNTVSKIGNNKYSLDFDYVDSDSIIGIKGKSEFKAYPRYTGNDSSKFVLDIRPGETKFDSIEVKIGITLGVKEDDDGVDRVFAKPNSDKITIENLDAVQVEEFYKSKYNKKEKRFGVGPFVGAGVGMGNNGQIVIRPQIGIGVQWNLFKF